MHTPTDYEQENPLRHGISERRLRYFHEAVAAGSMRGAADRLGVEPSIISRQIQQLERELGTILLERLGRGVRPTESAQVVLDHYRDRRVSEEALRVRLEELQGLQRGKINIAAGEGLAEELMQHALSDFVRQYPRVRMSLELTSVDSVVAQVARDDAHLGLAYAPPLEWSVQVVASKHHPVCVVCRPDHPLAQHPGRITARAVLPFPVAVMLPGFGLRRRVEMIEDTERIRYRKGFSSNSIAAIKEYVMEGLGVTFMTRLSVEQELATGQLFAANTDCRVLEDSWAHVIVRRKRPLSAAVKGLIAHLIDVRLFDEDKE